VGLREFKKERTRRVIGDTALRLFMQRGFERVTVAEVAEAAGVSEKTVFNYFPTKEDIFFDEADEREAALMDAVRNRDPGESIAGALRRLQGMECGRWCSEEFAGFARLIEESPALRAKELELMARFQRNLAATIVEDLGCSEFDAELAATMLVGVQWQLFVTARERALAGKHGRAAERRLRADLDRAYEVLDRGLGALSG
jgi:AcrR family transcriptional regulator